MSNINQRDCIRVWNSCVRKELCSLETRYVLPSLQRQYETIFSRVSRKYRSRGISSARLNIVFLVYIPYRHPAAHVEGFRNFQDLLRGLSQIAKIPRLISLMELKKRFALYHILSNELDDESSLLMLRSIYDLYCSQRHQQRKKCLTYEDFRSMLRKKLIDYVNNLRSKSGSKKRKISACSPEAPCIHIMLT